MAQELPDSEEVHRFLADEVRRRAAEKGLTIEELARLSEVGASHMWAVLAGTSSPTVKWLVAVSKTLGCRASKLIP